MKVRIGIDVGGTFTDGVAISNDTYEVLGKMKVPTTHSSEFGVAEGIIEVLERLMKELKIESSDIVFLAHGTTQATNALLEGDVSQVGIIATATGLEVGRARVDSNIDHIPLTEYKEIKTYHEFLDKNALENDLESSIERLREQGAEVIVAAEPYSVDNPENELRIQSVSEKLGIPSTATHEISSLYGLKLRTRTAVINASILPKMIETSNMTESSVKKANIDSQLMIMRCDGGVMSVDEVRSRPIMTLLSGPAAGVAGALMYEKISDGLFLEVGGTSTDISAIKNGEVMLKYAEVGGHKTYVNSLDVRTLGIAGGSMIRMDNNKLIDVGPRSAHIAGLEYEAFANPEDIVDPVLKTLSKEHEAYAYIECSNGKKFALTLTGAANILGEIGESVYSNGNRESSSKAYEALAKVLNLSLEETAQRVMDISVKKVEDCINTLIQEYELETQIIELVGGGGGAGSIVPYCGKKMNIPSRIAKNAEVISTIGVGLAMVREVVERSIVNPTEEDILRLRKESEEKVINSGANPKTVEIKVEIDKANSIVRAIATGSSELRQQEVSKVHLGDDELISIASKSMGVDGEVTKIAESEYLSVYELVETKKVLFGMIKNKTSYLRVLSKEGVIKLRLKNFTSLQMSLENMAEILEVELAKRTRYTDGGEEVPFVYVGIGSRILDMGGLTTRSQIISMLDVELKYIDKNQEGFILFGEK